MKALRRAWRRLAGSFAGSRKEADMADEFASHVEMLIEDNLARGMSPGEARRAALATFGGMELTKERYRDQLGFAWIGAIRQDLRYAFRGMRKSPGFTAVVVTCLSLGIGANAAIFSLVNAVMIRSLPVSHPEQLVLLRYTSKSDPSTVRKTGSGYNDAEGGLSLPYPAYDAMRKTTRTLAGIAAFAPLGFSNHDVAVGKGSETGAAGAEMVSGNFFALFGVAPVLGRAIVEDDLKPGAPNVAVLSHAYWSREFSGEISAVGRAITVNGAPFTVIGVAPAGFAGVDPQFAPDIWVPLRNMPALGPWSIPSRENLFQRSDWWWCMMLGRLQPGVSAQQARAELDPVFLAEITRGLDRMPPAEQTPHIALRPAARGLEGLRQQYAEPLRILLTAVVLVLLIACANVATLLVARAKSREKEVGVRLAVGASRPCLVRQFLTESVVLALAGGALGLALGGWASRALTVMSLADQPTSLNIRPDAAVLAFTVGVSVMTALLFGLAPALLATGVDVASQLKENARSVAPRGVLAKVLVAGQVALSVCLLIGAGLFARTLQNLQSQDFGFNRERLLLFQLDPSRAGQAPKRIAETYRAALEKIQALPGVRSATVSEMALLSGWMGNASIYPDGNSLPEKQSYTDINRVGPDFFATMAIRILLGRGIGWHEISGRKVAVINEAMAREFFPNGNPVGRHFSVDRKYDPAQAYEIIGVSQNAKYDHVRDKPPATAYLPFTADAGQIGAMWFEVRTAGDPLAMAAAVRKAVREIDPNLPLMDVKTQEQQIDQALSTERMFAKTSGCFGLLALLLVAVGVYGTIAYAVARRTNEIGIRMALGAGRKRMLWMVMRESLTVVACGLAVGTPVALILTRFVASMLFGVKQYDALTITVALLVLAAAGAAAALLPAMRASRIDPMQALRCE
jgi:predicted permease